MLVAGIDIGSLTGKAVVLQDQKVLAHYIVRTTFDSVETAQKVMERTLEIAGVRLNSISYIVATGYGRLIVPFAHKVVTEITCHTVGAHFLFPSARTILDMGGQDCKAIRCDGKGNVKNFAINDRCAAGAGKYLEVMAELLKVPLEEFGKRSLDIVSKPANISSACTVFARSDALSLVSDGTPKNDIIAGLHDALSLRVYSLLKSVGIEKDFVITGGIAKNIGMVKRMENLTGLKALISLEPQIVGALGAAILAERYVERN